MSVSECAAVNAVTTIDQRLDPSQRDDEAQQKEKMVGSVEDVHEPEPDEAPRRLVPPRVEANQARDRRRMRTRVRRHRAAGIAGPSRRAGPAAQTRDG